MTLALWFVPSRPPYPLRVIASPSVVHLRHSWCFSVKQGNWEWRNPQCPCNAAFILSITKLCNTDATWCWHRPKCRPPAARQASLEDGVFGSAAWSCFFLGGGVFHSDPSIIFKEQLFTFGDFKPTFLFSLILAVSFYSFFLVAFMSNCFRCTLNKIREFLLISQYWGTLWSHQLWAACHNMTLFMQERVLTKLASDVPRLNLSGKVVQVCDWLLNWYSGSHMYWWLIYFYFFKNKESVWIWYWILSLHCEPKSMPRWISMPEPTKALNIMFVTHVYWSSY